MKKTQNKYFEFIGKCVFFPKEKVLVFGDMHLGYEYMLRETGNMIPAMQKEQTFEEISKIFNQIKERKIKLNKVVFIGDLKHYFAFNKGEKNLLLQLLDLVEKYISRENIILIKGNHERMNIIQDKDFLDFYIYKNLCFIHGDKEIKETNNKEIKYIIMGHLHPAISIQDPQKIKVEKFKCFLVGKYKSKEAIILPSFLPLVEGTSVNEYLSDNHCIIPEKSLKNFEVFIIGEDEVLSFGKLKGIMQK